MKFSLITVTFNSGQTIRNTFDSVLKQTYSDFEYILIDGSSKDNTLDFIILENVGNLVCPAEFDTGACLNVAILSVPEGDDKPLKYPLMFEKCQVVIINKIDSMPAFDFDMDRVKDNIAMRNPEAVVFPISARTGEGMDAWCEWLKDNAAQYLGENQNG